MDGKAGVKRSRFLLSKVAVFFQKATYPGVAIFFDERPSPNAPSRMETFAVDGTSTLSQLATNFAYLLES